MKSPLPIKDEVHLAFDTFKDRTRSLMAPTLKLGVTGLARAGKTVFITALLHQLIQSNRMPLFEVVREGRLINITLDQQPNDQLARFEYEKHLHALIEERIWPQSTRSLSQIRLQISFAPPLRRFNLLRPQQLYIDLIDYPGEWLLDLPLLSKGFRAFSEQALTRAGNHLYAHHAKDWLAVLQKVNVLEPADEPQIEALSNAFKAYLISIKKDNRSLTILPPGRFLMPGELEGAPVLTFCPLANLPESTFPPHSLAAIMERRYEAYKKHVVRPFFRDHIARLDRQIVLIDLLQTLNMGRDSLNALAESLGEILSCFRTGKNWWLTHLWQRKITRVLVAATKSDHLHHTDHKILEQMTQTLVGNALARAGAQGAKVDTLALASVRATREGLAKVNKTELPVIIGTPIAGEIIDGQSFDGETETAIFPGDLPENLEQALKRGDDTHLRFIGFRPPHTKKNDSLPHIRLDRALEFLFGDYT
ncbi:YcjX family protein [Bartonella sp. DGB2]|uniref:YcjX family protein n=1 Tax=Bartonella sp. DGB2 TaxID=3388426 RepID=UPI00398FD3CF